MGYVGHGSRKMTHFRVRHRQTNRESEHCRTRRMRRRRRSRHEIAACEYAWSGKPATTVWLRTKSSYGGRRLTFESTVNSVRIPSPRH